VFREEVRQQEAVRCGKNVLPAAEGDGAMDVRIGLGVIRKVPVPERVGYTRMAPCGQGFFDSWILAHRRVWAKG
jgi:hypothetical protein